MLQTQEEWPWKEPWDGEKQRLVLLKESPKIDPAREASLGGSVCWLPIDPNLHRSQTPTPTGRHIWDIYKQEERAEAPC